MTAKDLPYLPLTELSRRLGAGETSSHDIVAACLERIAALDGHAHAFIEVYREAALDGAAAADLERKAGLAPRSAARPADRAQGSAAHQGRVTTAGSKSWHGRSRDRNRHRGREAARRRHDSARQDAHGRIRFRRLGAQRADGRAVESVGHARPPRRRRLEQRLRGRGRRGPGARRDRLGHRRIDTHPRRALRVDRPEADLRHDQPRRRRAAGDDARFARTAGAHRRRRRAADRGDGRARIRAMRPR